MFKYFHKEINQRVIGVSGTNISRNQAFSKTEKMPPLQAAHEDLLHCGIQVFQAHPQR